MNILHAIILGFIEGITEFLPISSTFHLLISKKFLGLTNNFIVDSFIVIIQSGAIFAAVFLYLKKILLNFGLLKNLLLSLFPTLLIAFVFHDFIKNYLFQETFFQIVIFIFVGILFIIFEKLFFSKRLQEKSITDLSIFDAILIGFAQSFAIVPGVSRSGIVLLFMLFRGYKRYESAEYTFMLGIPVLLLASGLDLVQLMQSRIDMSTIIFTIPFGLITAFFVSIVSMRFFVKYLQKNDLSIFGWYRVVLGFVLLIFRF